MNPASSLPANTSESSNPSSHAPGFNRRAFLLGGLGLAIVGPAHAGELEPKKDDADLIIWDSTPAALTAAVAAARAGLSVIIVTEDKHIGGLQTSGLGFTNAGQRPTIGGITKEFHQRILKYYVDKYGAGSAQVKASSDGYFFEPHVAEQLWLGWLAEAGVKCAREQVIDTVEKNGARLSALRTTSGRAFKGRIFLDASYEGDLLALAKCGFHLGRESRQQYSESLAGATYPPEHAGREDRKLQPFDYRCCLTDVPENRVPFTEPPGYDPANYAWLVSKRKNPVKLHQMLPLNMMPNRKTDSRTAEWPGKSWDYIDTSRARRREIELAHRHHSAGYLWFLMTGPGLTQDLRDDAARWGLPKDEFTDNGHWPWHVYVREGRRLVGEYVMTQRDCIEERFKEDSVGLCSWYLDVHPVELFKDGGKFVEDGSIFTPVKPFEISWRSLLPKAAEAENLLVPVALSSSHVAFSAIRVEPVWMILGQACGAAAALSLAADTPLHKLPAANLRAELTRQGQILDARPFNETWPARKK